MRVISEEEILAVAGGDDASCTRTANGGLECSGEWAEGSPEDFWIFGGKIGIHVVGGEVVGEYWDY
jgi:hypothetical protein